MCGRFLLSRLQLLEAMVQMIKKNRQDFRGMVRDFRLDELAELAKHVERSVAHHWGWVSDASAHDGKKCWQVPASEKINQKA